MIRARTSVAVCAGLLLGLTGASACVAQSGRAPQAETRITVRDLPPAVREAFRDAYPEAEVTAVTRENRDGKFLYHVQSIEGQTRRDLVYSADGDLVESQESLPPEEIPEAVRETMEDQCPNGALLLVRETQRGSEVTYFLRMACGEYRVNLVIDSSGQLLEARRTSGRRASERGGDQR